MLFCIMRPSFIQIGPPTAEIWRHVDVSRWRPRPQNITSGFVFVDVTAFRRSKSIRKLNFVDISGILVSSSSYLNSRLRYNYFHFRSRPFHRNLHIILHQATEFRQNPSTHCANMTSYPFLKMAAAGLNTTSGFLLFDATVFGRSKSISTSNFVDMSIHGGDITTSGFEKQTSAILEFYFRLQSWPFRRKLHFIQHQATEFRPDRSTQIGNMTSYPFIKMTDANAKYYFRFRICWCHCLQNVKIC